ncbi:MAG TPA: hypothetical protein VFL86_28730 [Burkholderiaceae bacterium]|nr:hypothetical protein [Burkholderiaceae bacterium]
MAAVSLGGMATCARAELVEIQWDANQAFHQTANLAPGKFIEVCGKLSASSVVDWQFHAAAPLNFNVHFHEGKEVRFPAKQDGVAKQSGQLVATSDQDYCWMWTNKGTKPSALAVELKRTR